MIQAKLFILNQEIELIWTDMRYVRGVKTNGTPDTRVVGGKISLCFETRDDTDLLLKWMTRESGDDSFQEENKMEEGKVCFYNEGFDYPPSKTYEFSDAYLIYYKEFSSPLDGIPLQTTLTISPAIQNYGVLHVEDWNINYVEPTVAMPYQPMDNVQERILECYYTDLDGNKNAEPEIGDEVYLVLVTENKIGQTIDIDLSDHSKDFRYNGEVLEDDMLKGFSISKSTEKIKLEIVPPQPEPINAQ